MVLGLICGRMLDMAEQAAVESRKARRVLIVEDDEDTRRLLKIALRSRDFLEIGRAHV